MGADQSVTRRDAVAALLTAAPALVGLSRKAPRPIAGAMIDDGSRVGHAMRDRAARPTPARTERVRVVILGAGVSGLGAAWALTRTGETAIRVLEAAPSAGGNARSGEHNGMRFPWGAHYLPVPGRDSTVVRTLCEEFGILRNGAWDERVLASDPQERIYRYGTWHEHIEPTFGLTRRERDEWTRFDDIIERFRATGRFRVPSLIDRSRASAEARALDGQTMAQWMDAHGLRSPSLRWMVDYGMRDDYGASLGTASAWAGVHYFAARPEDERGPLTWPEGNDWLVQQLLRRVGTHVRTNAPVWRVTRAGTRWVVDTPDVRYDADAVISAMPLHALTLTLDGLAPPPVTLERSPWLVANVHLDRWPVERGLPVAWENVIYDSPSLGYVVSTHQSVRTRIDRTVWTWYHAPVSDPPAIARRKLRDLAWPAARELVLTDLRRAHPDIDQCVTRIDVLAYGHAMPRPIPGFLSATERLRGWRPGPRFALAHSDASGLSLFEEALERGVAAAAQIREALRG
jgi:phytoene dehydrogenase-like protein